MKALRNLAGVGAHEVKANHLILLLLEADELRQAHGRKVVHPILAHMFRVAFAVGRRKLQRHKLAQEDLERSGWGGWVVYRWVEQEKGNELTGVVDVGGGGGGWVGGLALPPRFLPRAARSLLLRSGRSSHTP